MLPSPNPYRARRHASAIAMSWATLAVSAFRSTLPARLSNRGLYCAVATVIAATRWRRSSRQRGGEGSGHLDHAERTHSGGQRHLRKTPEIARPDETARMVDPPFATDADGCRGCRALGGEGVGGRAPRAERAIGESTAQVLHRPGVVVMEQRIAGSDLENLRVADGVVVVEEQLGLGESFEIARGGVPDARVVLDIFLEGLDEVARD